MPFDNLNDAHFTDAEKTSLETGLTAMETAIGGKLKNLSGEERQKYGSIKEDNKLLVNKVNDYRINEPALSSPDVDWAEFEKDFASRAFIQAFILRLQSMVDTLNNNKILHDYDNYRASLVDYEYSQYKMNTKVPGFERKVAEMSQFFKKKSSGDKPEDHTDS